MILNLWNKNQQEEFVQVIIECSMDDADEERIQQLGKIKYRLPIIDSYVIEIPKRYIGKLKNVKGVKKVLRDTNIKAHMNIARETIGAGVVQQKGYTGRGIGVAILDSGIYPHDDFIRNGNRIVAFKDFVNGYTKPYDDNNHGTHVAGIIGGDGYSLKGKYRGIAPRCNLVGVKVLDKEGSGNGSDVLAGMQWVLDNKQRYNIRVANISAGATPDEGEKSSLVKACNALWDAGITVVVAGGNDGPKSRSITSPGIGRKIITVGASDDEQTVIINGDKIANYSSRGPTKECIKKPDIVAPGSKIISCHANTEYVPEEGFNRLLGSLEEPYIELSGTSMATPMVAGAITLLLEKNPNMQPDDIKAYLKDCANNLHYPQDQQGWGLIDVEKLVLKERENGSR